MRRHHFSYIYIVLIPILILLLNGTASADSLSYTVPANSIGNGNKMIGYDHHSSFYRQGDEGRLYNQALDVTEIQVLEKEETAENMTIQDWNTTSSTSEISQDTVFDIFYGTNQTFGQPGLAQNWVNILGNVYDPDGIDSLSYTLNGDTSQYLSIGPDDRRLANEGDFNVEIDPQDLDSGANTVVISAIDGLDETAMVTVTVNYDPLSTWPLPYSVDWSTVSSLQDVVQIVDGEWSFTSAGVRTDTIEYDRVLAVGDVTWTDYEITVPITIHDFQPTQDGAGIGIAVRWTGHTNDPVDCDQPHCGWNVNGPRSWYPMETDGPLNLGPFDGGQTDDNSIDMNEGDTFYWKMLVQTVDSNTSNYALKVWESSQTEPSSWNISEQYSGFEPNGSPILIAHNVDATFGEIQIDPVGSSSPTYRLDIDIVGNGSVTRSPDKTVYSEGDQVTLTAVPASGSKFSSWSDDATGSDNPVIITMNSNKTVTATFTEAPSYSLTISPTTNGSVERSPNQTTYTEGTVVTLTAVPNPGWQFAVWGGNLSGNTNPTTITMDSNKTVTANFTQIYYTLEVSTVGSGSVTWSPNQTTYASGAEVTLTAAPAEDWQFAGWSGSLTGNTNPATVTMDDDKTITANFTEITYKLEVNPDGSGFMMMSPTQETYPKGTVVSLTAVPSAGWQFSNWSGDLTGNTNPATITMDDDKTITAKFIDTNAPTYTVTVNTTGSGNVVKSPNQATYPEGLEVTLTAMPDAGWQFSSWSGDLTGNTNSETITMNKDYSISATFVREGMEVSFFLPSIIKP